MGCSPQGKLFFGFQITEDEDDKLRMSETFKKFDKYRNEPVGLGLAGYDGELVRFVYIKESYYKSEWGEMIELSDRDMRMDEHWIAYLRVFCDREGIEFREPKFYLTSLYF